MLDVIVDGIRSSVFAGFVLMLLRYPVIIPPPNTIQQKVSKITYTRSALPAPRHPPSDAAVLHPPSQQDYEADRLMVSSLQLSDGTVVVLDETSLEPGKVGTEGVGNLAALNSLAALQKVPYDFGFYKMDFEVDHPTISLSLRGSVVPTGAVVPVVAASADEAGGSTASPASSEEGEGEVGAAGMMLERLRVYVEATRRTELSLDEASSALAEEDFVKARQQGQAVTVRKFLAFCWEFVWRFLSRPRARRRSLPKETKTGLKHRKLRRACPGDLPSLGAEHESSPTACELYVEEAGC